MVRAGRGHRPDFRLAEIWRARRGGVGAEDVQQQGGQDDQGDVGHAPGPGAGARAAPGFEVGHVVNPVCVTCGGWAWVMLGMWTKLRAGKMLEKAQNPRRQVHAVLGFAKTLTGCRLAKHACGQVRFFQD